MATANFEKLGCRAPWSAVLVLAISSATFVFAAGCGDVEDTPPGADAGTDVMSDVSGGDAGMTDAGGSDATPTPDATTDTGLADSTEYTMTYDECVAQCAAAELECLPEEDFEDYVRDGRLKDNEEPYVLLVGTAPSAPCVDPEPVEDACSDFQFIEETSWDCDHLTVTLLISPLGDDACGVSFEGDDDYLPFTGDEESIHITDERGNSLWTCTPAA